MRRHIAQLDALRAFAVLSVLLTHFWTYPQGATILNRIASFGWVGVDLFFVLSGFLITGILWETKERPAYFRNFYMRRALRIFPLYYALIFVVFLILPMLTTLPEQLAADRWMYFAYLSNIALAAGWQLFLVDITWSLAIEEQFYLLWPAVVRVLTKRRLTTVCISIIVGALLARTALFDVIGWRWAHMFMPLRMDSFAVGALLALWPSLGRWSRPIVAIGAIVLATLVLSGGFDVESKAVNTWGYTLTAVMSAGIISMSINTSWLKKPALLHLGKVSYGVYLLHPLCAAVVATAGEVVGIRVNQLTGHPLVDGLLNFTTLAAATWGVATVSFRIYETPFLRLKRFYENRSAPAPHAGYEARD